MKKYILFIALFYGNFAFAQIYETFNEDSILHERWSGSNSGKDFGIADKQLQSRSASASSSFYLSTPNLLSQNCIWEMWINLQFNPSSANYVDIYLMSDQPNLQALNINGYFVRLGGTNDEICLYKRSGTSSVKIIDGLDGILNSSNNKIKIKVSRTNSSLFILERDISGTGNSYELEGQVQDANLLNSSFFGIVIQQSVASFHKKHFFDDIRITKIITDSIPPKLVLAKALDSVSVEVKFDEAVDSISARRKANYTISPGYGEPLNIESTGVPDRYLLKLSKPLSSGAFELGASGIKDLAGNIILGVSTISFEFTKPYLVRPRDIVINEIFADPTPQIGMPGAEFIEIYNASQETLNLKNWKFSDAVSSATFPDLSIKPAEFMIVCAKADTNELKLYGKTIGLSAWPALNNIGDQLTIRSAENMLIDSVAYSDSWHSRAEKREGGWSLERVNYLSRCQGPYIWESSTAVSGGTPGDPNSVFIDHYDNVAFEADSLKQVSDRSLAIYLNKPAGALITEDIVEINPPIGGPLSITCDSSHRQMNVVCGSAFDSNTSYTLGLRNLEDCSGNSISTKILTFKTPPATAQRPDKGQILITEIFADPSPEVKLPLAEFVEIYNPSRDTVDLEGWSMHDLSSKTIFPKSWILPGEHLILCPQADALIYRTYGRSIGLTPWPSLDNSLDKITIRSFSERLVDSVSYSDTWHSSTAKKQGGWSLERIDPNSICMGIYNWASSTDTTGGSPGRRNSIYSDGYDHIPFKADSLKRSSDTTLLIYFNKPSDVSHDSHTFKLNPETSKIASASFDRRRRIATLLFTKRLAPGTLYELTISDLRDCAGNKISSSPLAYKTVDLPIPRTDTAHIYLSEIFADPSPEVGLPPAEFVEIYNPGQDTINLDGWTLSSTSTIGTINKTYISPREHLILCQTTDTSKFAEFGKTAGLTTWPGLTNTGTQLSLKSFKGRLVDSVTYSDTWHSSSSKKLGGWSLEKVDYYSLCKGIFNWTSSEDSEGGTPGARNSTFISDYDSIPFRADSIRRLSDTTISIYFNKHTDIRSAVGAFSIHPSLGINAIGFDKAAVKADLRFSKEFESNTLYTLTIDGLKDCSGRFTLRKAVLKFTTPVLPPTRLDTASVYFTEIFADPSPEVGLPLVEFLEIHNPGKDAVNLDGWSLNDPTNKGMLKRTSILPGEYLIFCPAADTSIFKAYGRVAGVTPWPSLNNSSDQISLKSYTGRLIDSVAYKDTWYKNSPKKNGGWSLERIDLESPCPSIQNWTASIDSTGGTPGRKNSMYKNYGSEPLKIIQAFLKDSISIAVVFNKMPDSVLASIPKNYTLNNGAGSPASVFYDPQGTVANLKFTQAISRGHTYNLSCSGIADCAGTLLSSPNNTVELFLPQKISKTGILINEVLFNPRSGGSDFVEIYNNSGSILDLNELSIATIKTADSVASIKALSTVPLFIKPGDYLVLSSDPDNLKKEYHIENENAFLKLASMPAYNNDKGTVVLLSGKERIDQLSYSEDMHFALVKDAKGVSLERSRFNRPTNENGNFRSAAASVGYATPGYKNSQFLDEMPTSDAITLVSKTFSPDNDGFEDILELSYHFAEAGMVANISIYNDKGILIKRLLKNSTLATEGIITWDGLTEDGQKASLGIYIVYSEVFNLNGKIEKYRSTCVLAARLY